MYLLRMILVALSAFVTGVSAAQAASLSCDEAREHLGEDREVCGLVAWLPIRACSGRSGD